MYRVRARTGLGAVVFLELPVPRPVEELPVLIRAGVVEYMLRAGLPPRSRRSAYLAVRRLLLQAMRAPGWLASILERLATGSSNAECGRVCLEVTAYSLFCIEACFSKGAVRLVRIGARRGIEKASVEGLSTTLILRPDDLPSTWPGMVRRLKPTLFRGMIVYTRRREACQPGGKEQVGRGEKARD